MKHTIIFILTVFTLFSCKEEKKETPQNNNTVVENKTEDYFSLSINAIVENDDEFTLFYLDEVSEQITKENSVSIVVTGSTRAQDLVFKLNEDVLPTRLILRFGNGENTQKISFNESRLDYYGKEILISKENFFQFFIPNEYIEFNRETHTATGRVVNGKYEPAFFSREILENKINYTL